MVTYTPVFKGMALKRPPLTEEWKRKISAAKRGKAGHRHTEESRNKIRQSKLGKKRPPLSEKWKANLSKSTKGIKRNPHSEEARLKNSMNHHDVSGENNPFYGKRHPQELIEQIKNNHPNFEGENNPFYGKHHTDETKRLMGSKHKGKMEKDKNPNWKGGVSFEPYCPKFNRELKEKIRNDFNRKCVVCGISESMLSEKLSIHHLDENKQQGCNGIKVKLIPLCRPCHIRAHHNPNFCSETLNIEEYNNHIAEEFIS